MVASSQMSPSSDRAGSSPVTRQGNPDWEVVGVRGHVLPQLQGGRVKQGGGGGGGQDIDPDTFGEMHVFMYSGKVANLDEKAENLLMAGEKYDLTFEGVKAEVRGKPLHQLGSRGSACCRRRLHCCWRLEDKCPSLPDDARCHGVLQGEAEDDIVKLPTEILPLIFFYLPYSDLLSVRVTHKNWQKLSQDEGLLKSIATRDFTWAPDLIQHLLPFLEITSEDRINHSSTLGLYKLCPEISYERKTVL